VAVMYQGSLVYHGSTPGLLEYFKTESAEDVFPKLAKRNVEEWHNAWAERRAEFAPNADLQTEPPVLEEASATAIDVSSVDPEIAEGWQGHRRDTATPGFLTQFSVLLGRRWRIFFRDKSQVWLHLALLFGFPCLVVIFALGGLPEIRNLNPTAAISISEQANEAKAALVFTVDSARIGQLASGLVIMQVILLTLMGSNNSAREIAGERLIFEKEKLGGLRPLSYLASKAAFLCVLVALQAFWMAAFVSGICHFPGDLGEQMVLLFLANAAMTSTCLAISSMMKSPEQASLMSIYLVGFQLPLSGAVLGLPDFFRWLTRPFIAAYWSWSGILKTMLNTRYYDAVTSISPTDLSVGALCIWALGCHVVIGLIISYLGCIRSRWE